MNNKQQTADSNLFLQVLSSCRLLFFVLLFVLCSLLFVPSVQAQEAFPGASVQGTTNLMPPPQPPAIPMLDLTIRNPQDGQEVAFSLQLLLLLTVLSLAPSIVILTTSFLRVSIVLDFIKRALSLQQVPPNQVILGISLFLTVFIMWPTFNEIYTNAIRPMASGDLSVENAYREAETPLRIFMFNQLRSRGGPDLSTGERNIVLFMSMRGLDRPRDLTDVPTYVLIPAFILNELTIAFRIGILLFIPFIVIDMVVASALMSMGMIMLPPVMISMPFKLILFILVDGWGLLTDQLVRSFF
ncbi:MAG: flagellar type III secretion system pore protein FliP [Treponema sp.]|jgi:flagellar biosynthetic protein FliP|nr:flagellar type III secretion system pore protein FliP [Treponema sp.]